MSTDESSPCGGCRTPHGVRELKPLARASLFQSACRTPHGVRELKRYKGMYYYPCRSRTPHGVRELKLRTLERGAVTLPVAPLTGCVN